MKQIPPQAPDVLTAVERRWYQCHAADILSGRFVSEQFGCSSQLIIAGLCGISGVLWLGWSSEQELTFLVIGFWVAIARNFVKMRFMFKGMENLVRNFEETGGISNVWYIVMRIKNPHLENLPDARQNVVGIQQSQGQLKQRLAIGTSFDLVMGGVSTVLLAAIVWGEISFDISEISNGSFFWALAGFLAYEVILTAIQVIDFRRHSETRYVTMYPGFTAAGLLILVAIVLMANEHAPQAAPKWTILTINAAIVSWGLGKIVWALLTWRKTVWLTKQLTQR